MCKNIEVPGGRILEIRDAKKKDYSNFKKAGVVLSLAVFIFGAMVVGADAKTRKERVIQVIQSGTEYIEIISRRIKNKDISNNANISYKKLNLKNSIKSSDLKNGVISGIKLKDGTITTAKIQDGAVTSGKIADGAIVTVKLADGSVTTAKIQNGAINTIKLADGSVTTAKVADYAITGIKIADDAVATAKIQDGAVTNGKLADGAVTTIKLADGSVSTVKIQDGAVTNAKIGDGEITGNKLAADITINTAGAITAVSFSDGTTTITGGNITTTGNITAGNFFGTFFGNLTGDVLGDVTGNLFGNADTATFATTAGIANDIVDNSISTAKIQDGAVTSAKIADGTILGIDLDPAINIVTTGVINATNFVGDLVGNATTATFATTAGIANDVIDNIISTAKIQDGAVTNPKLAADAVTTDKIADNTILGIDLDPAINIVTTGVINATNFVGNLTGNVLGDVTGNVVGNLTGDVTGNLTGNVTGDVTGNLFGNADTATFATTAGIANDVIDNSISTAKIQDSAVTTPKIADGAVTNPKLAADAVTTDKIADGTIVGADLDPAININTTGSIFGNIISDGTASWMGGDFATTSNILNMSIANNAVDSDVFIKNDGTGKANLNVEGNVTGSGNLGTNGSRWSTIYADTVNFLSGLTNADNTSGANSTINLGTAGADAAQVHIGNSSANISINDAEWSITSAGAANFQDLSVAGDIAAIGNGSFQNIVALGSGTFGGTVTAGGQLLVTAGGFDITGNSDMRGDINMNGNVLENIGDSGTDFTGAGGLILADQLTVSGGGIDVSGGSDIRGNVDMHGNDITNAGTISGTINAQGGHNSDITVKGSDGNDCTINIDNGIITGTTCP